MSAQRHVIKRQIFELTIADQADAPRLQEILSRAHQQRLVALIDDACAALSSPGVAHRIDTLDIDLGVIDLDDFEDSYVAAFQSAFYVSLARKLTGVESAPAQADARLHSDIELFATFARTGSLPWWADMTNPHLLDETLDRLLATPGPLRQLFQTWRGDAALLRRIIHYFGDALLNRLVSALTGHSHTEDVVKLAPSIGGREQRALLWLAFLSVAADDHGSVLSFYKAALKRLAVTSGVSYGVFVEELYQRAMHDATLVDTSMINILKALTRWEIPLSGDRSGAKHVTNDDKSLLSLAAALEDPTAFGAALERLARVLRVGNPSRREGDALELEELPDREGGIGQEDAEAPDEEVDTDDEWLRADERQGVEKPVGGEKHRPRVSQAQTECLIAQLRAMLVTSREIDPRTIQQALAQLAALEGDGVLRSLVAPLKQMLRQALDQTELARPEREHSVDSIEEFYVGNAGLVILWPFLAHFFANLDLLEERQFKDRAAMLKAIGILQYLVTGETEFPEYWLPLNKVLCGMTWEDVYDLNFTLSEDEREACDALLEAVIAHAPILNDMSIAGLRRTFLLRQGILSARDGAWLLRVERETYDIVLERFPWNWAWVKLPWMDDMMRVEW